MKLLKKLTALLLALTMLLGVTALAEDDMPDQIDMDEIVVVDGVAINAAGE